MNFSTPDISEIEGRSTIKLIASGVVVREMVEGDTLYLLANE